MATLKDIQDRKITLKGIKQTQTVRVRVKGPHGAPSCILNIKDFNDDLHEKLSDEDSGKAEVLGQSDLAAENAKAAAALVATTKAKRVTPLTRVELSGMSMEALKLTPEWPNIPANKRSKIKDKDGAIDAIIDARKVSGR